MKKSQFAKYCLAFSLGIILASIICNTLNENKTIEKSCDCETEKKEEINLNEGSKCNAGVSSSYSPGSYGI